MTFAPFGSGSFPTSDKLVEYPRLAMSASIGDLELTDEDLDDINRADSKGNTPLHYAVSHGHPESVRTLLQQQAQPNVQNRDGETPLFMAARANHVLLCELLLNWSANPDIGNIDGLRPVHIAASEGFVEILEILWRHRANLNVQDHEGDTPLHYATQYSRLAAVQYLCNHGCNVSLLANEDMETALDVAQACGPPDLADFLHQSVEVGKTELGRSIETTLAGSSTWDGQSSDVGDAMPMPHSN